jgi:hypothetical protein
VHSRDGENHGTQNDNRHRMKKYQPANALFHGCSF